MDKIMYSDISKILDSVNNGTNEDSFFVNDDVDDLYLKEVDSIEMESKKIDSLTVLELQDVVRETIREVISQIDVNKINYLVSILDNNIGLVNRVENIKKGNVTPAKKNVADIDIETDYMNGMSCLQIARKYNFTEDGIRKRLQKLGVYKSKYRRQITK